jgi:aldehyde:ferredoxin oxidoreductase
MYHFDIFNVPDVGIVAPKCTGLSLSFATRLWNNDYKLMLQASSLCNSYGLDFTTTTNIIAFLMELYHQGIITEHDTDGIPIKRGDEEGIISTIHKIARQEGFGRLFQSGLLDAARTIGKGAEQCAMHVKGLEMSATEPRIFKSGALAYAMCKDVIDAPPLVEGMSGYEKETAEKLAFELVGSKEASHKDTYEKKGHLTWDSENRATALDVLGICRYFFLSMGIFLDVPAKLFSLATGVDMDESGLLSAAQRVRTLERAFNVTRGMKRIDDSLPKRLFEVAVPHGQYEGTRLDKELFDAMVDDYYATSGWDENGIPKEETFSKLDLASEWKLFSSRMKKRDQTDV